MGMMRNNPYIAHSELTNEIYIIDRQTKYPVTDQVVKAVVATDRAIPKADYEARLKADLKAILTEIQLEIEELYPEHQCTGELTGFADAIETITPIIQQKINALKADQEGEE